MIQSLSEDGRILFETDPYCGNNQFNEGLNFPFENICSGGFIRDSKMEQQQTDRLYHDSGHDINRESPYRYSINLTREQLEYPLIVEIKVLTFARGVMKFAKLRFDDYYKVTGSFKLAASESQDSDISNFFESWKKKLGLKIQIHTEGIEFCGLIRTKNVEAIARSWYYIFIDDLLIDSPRLLQTYSHVISKGIKRMGFKHIKKQKYETKTSFLYGINDNTNEHEPDWATFPVLINVKRTIMELRIIFALKSRPGLFNANQLKYVKKHIKKANLFLKNCSFHYEPKKEETVFKITHYLLYPPSLCFDLPQKLTSEAVHYYTSFGYGFYALSKSKVTERFNQDKGENEILLEPGTENEKITTVTLEKLFKKCVKRNSKPVSVFSLIVEGLLHLDWFRRIRRPKEFLQEISIIKAMEKSSLLKKSFMLADLRVRKNEISYPINNYEEYKRTFASQSHSNPEIYDKLIMIIEELAHCGLGVDLDTFIDSMIEVDSELFYAYKIDLSKQFWKLIYQEKRVEDSKANPSVSSKQAVHQYNTIYDYLSTMHSKLNERILNEITENPWTIDDLFISFDENLITISDDEVEYFGHKLSKEKVSDDRITIKDQMIPNERIRAKKSRIDAPFLTIQRYRINQMFKNKYIVRYLGLYDNCTIWAEKVFHNSVHEIIKENLMQECKLDQRNIHEIKKNLAKCFKEVSMILTSTLTLACGLLSCKFFLDLKEPNVGKTVKFHILHFDEIKFYHSDMHLLFIGQDPNNGKSNRTSPSLSFQKLMCALTE